MATTLTAYADAADYRLRSGDISTGTVTELNEQLLAMSRLLDRALNVEPGAFNSSGSDDEVRYVDCYGGSVLTLQDRDGRRFWLQSVAADGIGIDSEYDGTYDGYALDFADAWVRGLPENAAAASEPYHSIELLSGRSGATVTTWPHQRAGVKITGTMGWAAVPNMIIDLVCHRVEELKAGLKEGGLGSVPAFAAGEPMRPGTAWLFKQAEDLYGRKRGGVVFA